MNNGGRLPDTDFIETGQSLRDLKALEALEESPTISQRELAKRLGIALGLTNACLTSMAKKGLIKISRVNSRNLTYHLTPEGFAAKARLSLEYARATISTYRAGREMVIGGVAALAAQGITHVGLLGATDIAEIVGIVCAHEGMKIVWVADENPAVLGRSFMGHPVGTIDGFATCGCEAVIVATFEDADFWVRHARDRLPSDIIVVKAL